MSGIGYAGCCKASPCDTAPIKDEMFCNMALDFLNEIFETDLPFPGTEKGDVVTMKVKRLKVRKKVYDENIKFSYYGNTGNCNNHDGIITLCSTLSMFEGKELSAPAVIYGVAYCSPEDVYNKEIGKSIAYDDMQQVRAGVDLVHKNHHDINTRIFADMVAHDDGPSWAKKSIARILIRHTVQAFKLDWMEI